MSKKSAVLSAVFAVAITAAAVAYLSAGGSGSGSGSVTATTSNMTLTSSSLTLSHIGDTETVQITASNPGSSPQELSGPLTVTAAPATGVTGCASDSFTVSNIQETGNQIPAKSGDTNGTAVVGSADITFTNRNSAQNGCIGTDKIALTLGG